MVVSSDYDSTHEANHSDSSDVAHTEEDTEEGKSSGQNVILHPLIPPEVAEPTLEPQKHNHHTSSFTCTDAFSPHAAGQTHPGSRTVVNGGLGSMDESAKQLELPHLHFDGEDQREMWTNPESGETETMKLLFVLACCF